MAAIPPIERFTDPTTTEHEFREAFAQLHDYLTGLLGTDGTPGAARAALSAEEAGTAAAAVADLAAALQPVVDFVNAITASAAEINRLDGISRTTEQLNATYYAGGPNVPISDGGTGASTASAARSNLGLGSLATKNNVGSGDINNRSITANKIDWTLGGASVSDSNWTVPAGLFLISTITERTLQFRRGGTWHSAGVANGLVMSDGSNVRITGTGTLQYLRLM